MTDENNNLFRGLRALAVDPDPVFLRTMKEHLEAFGFEVRTATTRREAEKLAEEISFQLLISEILLEEPDGGFVLTYHLRSRCPSMRIVLVSGVSFRTGFHFDLSDPESRAWIRADEILDKEIRFEQLEHLLARFFREKNAAAENGSAQGCGSPAPD